MKHCCASFLFCIVFNGVAAQQGTVPAYATVTLHNPSGFERTEVVSIPWSGIREAAAAVDTATFRVVLAATGATLPFQFERAGTNTVQNLLVLVSLPARAETKLLLQRKSSAPIRPLTFGRHVPERKDDFAWENNRVAFRMYGKALAATNENAYGIDVWSKRTDSLVIDKWYLGGDYHKDHGSGLDYYSVGYTLGAGDAAPYIGDSLWFSHNHHQWEVLDNGPLRTTFRLSYPAREVAGRLLTAHKTISLDAGTQLNRITVRYDNAGDSLPVAIGIVRRASAGVQLLDEQAGVLGYWEPTHPASGTTGVGVLCTSAPVRARQDPKHWLLTGRQAKEFTYYAGACWDRAGLYRSSQQWFDYLRRFREALQQPVSVRVQ
ncbi:DUF4861 family protein [Flaviaesturariibacter amylovorans]|uniref:DUF4861 domain-containing protein n=1 Tax=Flaviaesturariibacter amylovorans TaxID=1084520 RepID=A0ABP8H799_9BACT